MTSASASVLKPKLIFSSNDGGFIFLQQEMAVIGSHQHPSRQMPDGGHHDPHVERELVGTALLEKLPVEEHAGPLAELKDGA